MESFHPRARALRIGSLRRVVDSRSRSLAMSQSLVRLSAPLAVLIVSGCVVATHPVTTFTEPADLLPTRVRHSEPAVVTTRILATSTPNEPDALLRIQVQPPQTCTTSTVPEHVAVTERKVDESAYALMALYAATTASVIAFGATDCDMAADPQTCAGQNDGAITAGAVSAALLAANAISLIHAASSTREEPVPEQTSEECVPCSTEGRAVSWPCGSGPARIGALDANGRVDVTVARLRGSCPDLPREDQALLERANAVEIDWTGCAVEEP